MKDMNIKHVFVLAAVSLAGAGCYQQMPLTTLPPAAGTRVIAELTDSGTVALGHAIGVGAQQVEGVVTTADANVWGVQMLRVTHRDGRLVDWNREVVSIRPNLLTNMSVKVLDKKRSWLAAGGIAVGAILLARTFDLLGSSEEDMDEQPPAQKVMPTAPIPFGGK